MLTNYDLSDYTGPEPFGCDPFIKSKAYRRKDEKQVLPQPCVCGKCLKMNKAEEQHCCRYDLNCVSILDQAALTGFDKSERTVTNEVVICHSKVQLSCITELDEFATVCLAPATLRMVLEDLSEREESERPDITIPPESYRYAAYRTFTKWARRRGRKGHRHVIPSCVVTSIRKTYPDPNHVYTGFYY